VVGGELRNPKSYFRFLSTANILSGPQLTEVHGWYHGQPSMYLNACSIVTACVLHCNTREGWGPAYVNCTMQPQFENIKESWLLTHFLSIGSAEGRSAQGKVVAEPDPYIHVEIQYLNSKASRIRKPNKTSSHNIQCGPK
jgi:hypothetical protein